MELDPRNINRRITFDSKIERERERENGRKIINRAPVRRKVNDKETAR